jgi:hypothetical protein
MVGMSLGREYLAVVLRLRRLIPGWVESYVGPSSVAEVSVAGLRAAVDELGLRVASEGLEPLEPDRREWLLAQLQATSTALLWRGGERLSYRELFARCHGARVEVVPDQRFQQAHALLDGALPGSGDVRVGYRRWRDTQLVPRERLHEGLSVLAGEMRRRARDLFELPEEEEVTWKLVSGERWAGNAEYLGRGQTLIRINADLPAGTVSRAAPRAAHAR